MSHLGEKPNRYLKTWDWNLEWTEIRRAACSHTEGFRQTLPGPHLFRDYREDKTIGGIIWKNKKRVSWNPRDTYKERREVAKCRKTKDIP